MTKAACPQQRLHDTPGFFVRETDFRQPLRKWTLVLVAPKDTSGGHVFKVNAKGFALILQAHGTKPSHYLPQEATIGQR